MYNLKKGKGTFKGVIGECLFKLTRKQLVLTKFFNKSKYLDTFGRKFSEQEKEFILKNWFSIDAIEFDYTQNKRKVILFEIKTKNKYDNPKPNWIPKITISTYDIYNKALKLGFDVRLAIVWLEKDWNYNIELKNFAEAKYCIDKPKKYDKS